MSAPGGREGVSNNADTEVDRGREGVWLLVGILLRMVSVREKREFKGHFIIMFLS